MVYIWTKNAVNQSEDITQVGLTHSEAENAADGYRYHPDFFFILGPVRFGPESPDSRARARAYLPRVRLREQGVRGRVVPAAQGPVERLGSRAEVHVLDHRVGEKQRGHHPGGQLVGVVRLGDHEHHDEHVLGVYDYGGDPAVHLPEQHGQPGIIVVVLGYEQAGHLYQPDVRPQVLDETVLLVTHGSRVEIFTALALRPP